MAQHDYNIANQTGLEFRADLNNALQAIVTDNSGATAPSTTFPGMVWRDTSVSPSVLKKRNDANNAWVTVLTPAGEAISGATNASSQRTALGLGTAATLNAGTSANNVVQLDGTGKLPAVDGSALTKLPPLGLGNAAYGNVGTAPWSIVQIDGTGKLPAVDGSQVLNLPKSTVFASAAENIGGTTENKAVSPLGLRQAFNAWGWAPVYACRAWVNFNGTNTVAIRASGNVSSITDNGTGIYTVNFTTAMPDENYCATGSALMSGIIANLNVDLNGVATYLATSCRIRLSGGSATVDGLYDSPIVTLVFFR